MIRCWQSAKAKALAFRGFVNVARRNPEPIRILNGIVRSRLFTLLPSFLTLSFGLDEAQYLLPPNLVNPVVRIRDAHFVVEILPLFRLRLSLLFPTHDSLLLPMQRTTRRFVLIFATGTAMSFVVIPQRGFRLRATLSIGKANVEIIGMSKKCNNRRHVIRVINAERKNSEHPETFLILTPEERRALAFGQFAKLCFETTDPKLFGERMWVKVCECVEGEIYIGTLDNHPVNLPLRYGTWIRFRPEHILDIESLD
jgi:hypothetical protein